MAAEDDFRALLADDPTIAGLVGPRIAWSTIPEGEERPCIALWPIAGEPDYTMQGESSLESRLVQVDCHGMTYLSARAVALAVAAKLGGFAGTKGGTWFQGVFRRSTNSDNEPVTGNPAQRYYRVSVDFELWASPT